MADWWPTYGPYCIVCLLPFTAWAGPSLFRYDLILLCDSPPTDCLSQTYPRPLVFNSCGPQAKGVRSTQSPPMSSFPLFSWRPQQRLHRSPEQRRRAQRRRPSMLPVHRRLDVPRHTGPIQVRRWQQPGGSNISVHTDVPSLLSRRLPTHGEFTCATTIVPVRSF